MRPREDGHVMTEAEMDDEATAQGTRGAPISWGGRKGPAWSLQREYGPAHTFILDFRPPEL